MSCWLPGTHAGSVANNNIHLFQSTKINNTCHVLKFDLYISGLCTVAVEQQKLHEDNTFPLNSEILQCTRRQNWFPVCDLCYQFMHNNFVMHNNFFMQFIMMNNAWCLLLQ